MTSGVLSAQGASDWGCVTKGWYLAGGCLSGGVADQGGITRGHQSRGVTRGCTMHSEHAVNAQ